MELGSSSSFLRAMGGICCGMFLLGASCASEPPCDSQLPATPAADFSVSLDWDIGMGMGGTYTKISAETVLVRQEDEFGWEIENTFEPPERGLEKLYRALRCLDCHQFSTHRNTDVFDGSSSVLVLHIDGRDYATSSSGRSYVYDRGRFLSCVALIEQFVESSAP